MPIRLLIVSLAWALMLMVTYLNVVDPFEGGFNVVVWFAYLIVLTAIILWPRSARGERIEAAEAGWSRAA